MIVVMAYCKADVHLAQISLESLAFMERGLEMSGGTPEHTLYLMATERVDPEATLALVKVAQCIECFTDVQPIQRNVHGAERRHNAVNWAFAEAMELVEPYEDPMFWCEPDTVFVGAGALDCLEATWRACKCDILGNILQNTSIPGMTLAGVAVYGRNAMSYLNKTSLTCCDTPFDIGLRRDMLNGGWGTSLIAHHMNRIEAEWVEWARWAKNPSMIYHGFKDDSLWKLVRDKGLFVKPPLAAL